jgi:hypothetical protein
MGFLLQASIDATGAPCRSQSYNLYGKIIIYDNIMRSSQVITGGRVDGRQSAGSIGSGSE